MTDRPLQILLLEDSAVDAELILQELRRAGIAHALERVENEAAFLRALKTFAPDVILSDHALADFDAMAALRATRTHRPGTPVIIVTGTFSESTRVAIDSLKAGADDLILKANLARLGPSVEAAVAVRRPLRALSPRQFEVLRLIAQGQSTRDIARRLKLGVKTIETHRAAVMKRLNIHDVAGLARFAIRVGLIPPEP
jgi:DNA-binding NarL/FixJ family response regulator